MVPRISPREAFTRLREGYTYLDVRSESEFREGHPRGAVNVPWRLDGPVGTVPNARFGEVVELRFGRDAPLVIGCWSGVRSAKAVATLAARGFTRLAEQRAGWDGARGPFGELVEGGWRRVGLASASGEPEGSTYAELLATLGLAVALD